jgi:GNAT superfamily N-acetyltransferase
VPLIFCLPYALFYPEYIFVLDDGHGHAVGYVLAAPDAHAFLARWKAEYLPYLATHHPELPPAPVGADGEALKPVGNEIEHVAKSRSGSATPDGADLSRALLARLYNPDATIVHPECPALVREYPAHLHVDLLPGFQGGGRGKALIEVLFEAFANDGVRGCHLLKAGDNEGTTVFYQKIGFSIYGQIMDGGLSGEKGRKSTGGICMVRKTFKGGDSPRRSPRLAGRK